MTEGTHVLAPFGWPVVIYLTLAGIAVGSALVSAWMLFRGSEADRRPAVRGFGLAALAIALGGLALVADLEAPGRFWLILAHFNPGSWIAWGARIITVFGILSAYAWMVLRRRGDTTAMTAEVKLIVGLLAVLAVVVGLYPGWVLLQAAARPLWGSPLIAPLFLLSAIHSGLAVSLLLSGNDNKRLGPWPEALVVLAQIGLGLAWFLTVTPDYGDAARRMISGDLAVWLWGGVVFTGWLVPLEVAMIKRSSFGTTIVRAAAVLIGGLALRALVVFGGQGSAALISTVASTQP